MAKSKKLRSDGRLFNVINSTVLVLVALICVYPLLYVFFVACSDGVPLSRGQVTFLPKGFQLESFRYILTIRASTWARACSTRSCIRSSARCSRC